MNKLIILTIVALLSTSALATDSSGVVLNSTSAVATGSDAVVVGSGSALQAATAHATNTSWGTFGTSHTSGITPLTLPGCPPLTGLFHYDTNTLSGVAGSTGNTETSTFGPLS